MTPEELCAKMLGNRRIPLFDEKIRELLVNAISAAYAVAYEESARICERRQAGRCAAEIRNHCVALLSQEISPKTPDQGA